MITPIRFRVQTRLSDLAIRTAFLASSSVDAKVSQQLMSGCTMILSDIRLVFLFPLKDIVEKLFHFKVQMKRRH